MIIASTWVCNMFFKFSRTVNENDFQTQKQLRCGNFAQKTTISPVYDPYAKASESVQIMRTREFPPKNRRQSQNICSNLGLNEIL